MPKTKELQHALTILILNLYMIAALVTEKPIFFVMTGIWAVAFVISWSVSNAKDT